MCLRVACRHQGTENYVKEGRGVKETDRRMTVGGERSDIQCDLFVVMKSVPYTHIFHLYVPAEFGV